MARDFRFYTVEQLGPTRFKTPEGFLVCQSVPIARTGTMVYGPDETPIPVGDDGRVYIMRSPFEVFKPESMASINGKPVTDDHPPVDVDPKNWQMYTRGIVFNPRRGENNQNDLLVADIIIYDADTIRDVEEGKREVSCGYNPEYLPIRDDSGNEQPGRGQQIDIIYNHLALVDRGRCGPRCSIGDRRTVDKESAMSSWKDKLLQAFGAKDTRALDEAITEIEQATKGGGMQPHIEVHNHMTKDEESEEEKKEEKKEEKATDQAPSWFSAFKGAMDAQFKAINDRLDAMDDEKEEEEKEKKEGMDRKTHNDDDDDDDKRARNDDEQILGELEFEAPPGTGDAAKRARDSGYLQESFQDTLAKAEILVPGISVPTFDRAADPRKTFKKICDLRRTALDLAYNHAATRGLIDAALSGRELNTKSLSCRDVRTVFNAVAGIQAQINNSRATDNRDYLPATGGGTQVRGNVRSLSDINKRNAERYGKKSA